jgi:probable rRNA maturation factor
MRALTLTNLHPRLRLDRAGLARALATLDGAFRFTPADVPHLARATRPHARAQLAATRGRGRPVPSACAAGELSLVFMTDTALAELHGRFLDDPAETDVMTFTGDPALDCLGEICVSADRAARVAPAHGHDFAEELMLYVAHGWLHLAGYDDLRPAHKRRMRAAEARALRLLRTAAAIPRCALRSADL